MEPKTKTHHGNPKFHAACAELNRFSLLDQKRKAKIEAMATTVLNKLCERAEKVIAEMSLPSIDSAPGFHFWLLDCRPNPKWLLIQARSGGRLRLRSARSCSGWLDYSFCDGHSVNLHDLGYEIEVVGGTKPWMEEMIRNLKELNQPRAQQ